MNDILQMLRDQLRREKEILDNGNILECQPYWLFHNKEDMYYDIQNFSINKILGLEQVNDTNSKQKQN